MTKVVIYSRPGCHLCEEAREAIQEADCARQFTLEEVNIESDPGLLQRYQCDIPVITINGVEVFRHKVSSAEFAKELLRRS